MSCLGFHVTVVWLPLLLGCFFTLCESQGSSNHVFSNSQQTYSGSSNESGKSALSQPGVVVGIIVGVAGVLVVVGVSILLCRLFCCKESTACCCCCKQEERYLEAGTVPIKVPSEEGTPDNNLTRTRQPPQNNTRKTSDSSPNPPQYDDILVPDWKLDNMTKNKQPKTSDRETKGSQDSLHDAVPRSENSPTLPADCDETANNLSSGAAKLKKPTPTRRKLTYEGAENPDLTQDSADFASSEQHRRPKKHDRREFPVTGHKHRKENVKTPQHEDAATVERNTDEMTSGREFPLLEYEPGARKVRNFSYNPSYADASRETWKGYGDQGEEFRPVEFDHQQQYLPAASYYPDHSGSRVRGEDRRPWPEHTRETFAPPVPAPIVNSSNPPHHNVPYISGRVNPAFNQETTETEV